VIDRRTAFICVALIVLMLAGAMWRITVPDDWMLQAIRPSAPLLPLFIFPACSAFVVGVLYCQLLRVRADIAKTGPWRKWGARVSISYCAALLLAQALVIIMSLEPGMHLHLWAVYRALFVLIGLMFLVAVNQMPKLPYFERRFAPGGDLGPIYGPRFMRTQSRLLFVFMTALMAYWLALPWLALSQDARRHSVLYVLLATVCLFAQSIALRRHLCRKWNLEQLASRGVNP
jgi:hypothetical protein